MNLKSLKNKLEKNHGIFVHYDFLENVLKKIPEFEKNDDNILTYDNISFDFNDNNELTGLNVEWTDLNGEIHKEKYIINNDNNLDIISTTPEYLSVDKDDGKINLSVTSVNKVLSLNFVDSNEDQADERLSISFSLASTQMFVVGSFTANKDYPVYSPHFSYDENYDIYFKEDKEALILITHINNGVYTQTTTKLKVDTSSRTVSFDLPAIKKDETIILSGGY